MASNDCFKSGIILEIFNLLTYVFLFEKFREASMKSHPFGLEQHPGATK